ncbi:hypothetical protein Tdes44962_MAKER09780 [Teratosphaeria destructans]|uniref:PD-(D/E)XK nuclease-like domain-containing protein n=1 Tax=Teratosphaeria destructans TaxID=418781 RepID=A0A9W7W1X3_9PEZI|nr:hypothetical protein Tdes44962_MAKER09780 [Teratosphaeria destructans]
MSGNAQRTPVRSTVRRKLQQDALVDDGETPRAPQYQSSMGPFSALPPSSPGPSQSSRSSAFSTDSQSAKKRKREVSPTKQVDDAQYHKWAIVQKTVENIQKDVDPAIREVVRQIQRIKHGKGIIHHAHATDELKQAVGTGDEELDKDIFTKTGDRRGDPPPIARMDRIKQRSTICAAASASEPDWNNSVHCFVLEESCLSSGLASHVTTTATIEPGLLPELTADNNGVQSRKVDFCIVLQLSRYSNVGQAATLQNINFFNQTKYGPIRFKPITVSIETKLPVEGGAKALVQLETWAQAQIQRLENLHSWVGDPWLVHMPLPLIAVHGDVWKLYYMQQNRDGHGGTMWDCGEFGSTKTLLGTYQVVAGLQALMQWSVEVYQPWFEDNILRRFVKLRTDGQEDAGG